MARFASLFCRSSLALDLAATLNIIGSAVKKLLPDLILDRLTAMQGIPRRCAANQSTNNQGLAHP